MTVIEQSDVCCVEVRVTMPGIEETPGAEALLKLYTGAVAAECAMLVGIVRPQRRNSDPEACRKMADSYVGNAAAWHRKRAGYLQGLLPQVIEIAKCAEILELINKIERQMGKEKRA